MFGDRGGEKIQRDDSRLDPRDDSTLARSEYVEKRREKTEMPARRVINNVNVFEN